MVGKKLLTVSLLGLLIASCTANSAIGAGVGAAGGAVLGQAIGKDTEGTLIGAGIGAAAGAAIGTLFDKQEEELNEELEGTGIDVERVDDDEIKLTAPENVTFATGSSTISSEFKTSLNSIADVLNTYPDTEIVIKGHTDSTGTDAINNPLSQDRADNTKKYLVSKGVSASRLTSVGYGSKKPIASNDTADGRAQNRRVEFVITPKS